MSEEFDKTYLVCALVTPGSTMPPGFTKLSCDDCEREIWCSPSGQKLLLSSEEPIVLICMECSHKRMHQEKEQKGEVEVSLAPGAAEEISAFLRQPPVP